MAWPPASAGSLMPARARRDAVQARPSLRIACLMSVCASCQSPTAVNLCVGVSCLQVVVCRAKLDWALAPVSFCIGDGWRAIPDNDEQTMHHCGRRIAPLWRWRAEGG